MLTLDGLLSHGFAAQLLVHYCSTTLHSHTGRGGSDDQETDAAAAAAWSDC